MPTEPRTPRLYHERAASAFTALGAFGVACTATASLLVIAVFLGAGGAPPMVVAVVAQLALAATPFVILVLVPRGGAVRTSRLLGLAPAAPRYFVAAALLGASAWYLNLRLVELLPIPHEDASLAELVERPSLPVVLAVVALTPAVCEELLFRGVLVRGFATRLAPALAVVLAALLFAGYHFRVVQLVPTFTLGLVLGALALRADSAVPGMLLHLLNNALALLVARGELPALADALTAEPTIAVVGCAIASAAGIGVLATGTRGAPRV